MTEILSKSTQVVLPSAARTTAGQSGAIGCGSQDFISIFIEATALSGTPTLAVNIEWSNDGTNWAQQDTTTEAFANITTVPTRKVKTVQVKGLYFRLNYNITGGTPNITFSATAVGGF